MEKIVELYNCCAPATKKRGEVRSWILLSGTREELSQDDRAGEVCKISDCSEEVALKIATLFAESIGVKTVAQTGG